MTEIVTAGTAAEAEGKTGMGPLDIGRVMAALPHRYPLLLVDRVEDLIVDTSITKAFVNQMAVRVTNEAMQLGGAYGMSTEFPYERHFRDARGMSIGYGTVEIHKSAIAREVLSGRYPF